MPIEMEVKNKTSQVASLESTHSQFPQIFRPLNLFKYFYQGLICFTCIVLFSKKLVFFVFFLLTDLCENKKKTSHFFSNGKSVEKIQKTELFVYLFHDSEVSKLLHAK